MGRFPSSFTSYLFNIPCIPIGLLLVIMRCFISVGFSIYMYFLGMILSPNSPVVRCMVKLFYLVLGQIISVSREDKLVTNCIIVANKVSSLEGIFLSLAKGYQIAVLGNAGFFESNFFNFTSLSSNSSIREKQLIEMKEKNSPIIVFPETVATNNACLLPFSDWAFSLGEKIQPMTIEIIRPQPINICHLQSRCVVDVFWSFFCFFTYYDVTVHKPLKCEDFKNVHLFKEATRNVISQHLGIKKIKVDDPTIQNKTSKKTETTFIRKISHYGWSNEIRVVRSVIATADKKVILNELEKTNCLHQTIVNFLEEKVKHHNNKVLKKEIYVKNPEERHMSLQEKKLSFVQRARNEYISKFSLR